MKKSIFALTLAVCIAGGGAFAQGGLFDLTSGPSPQKSAIFVDVGPLLTGLFLGGFGAGLGYEFRVANNLSVMVHGDFIVPGIVNYKIFMFDIDPHVRWYFFNTTISKFYADVGLGYGLFSASYDSPTNPADDWDGSVHYFNLMASLGWKFIIGPGFVLEPWVGASYGLSLASSVGAEYSAVGNDILSYGVNLGWAF
jgi:hypothetical protein